MTTAVKTLTNSEYIHHHMQNWQLNLHSMSYGNGGFWTLDLDTLLISLLLGIGFLWLFYAAARKATSGVPGKWQNVVEMAVSGVEKITRDSTHMDQRFIASMALTVFVWVFLMNFMDLVPLDLVPMIMHAFGAPYFRAVPTADPAMTFALSIVVFLLILYYNVKAKGALSLTKEVLSKPFGWWGLPVNLAFRIIEEVVKPISLSLRLFGNLFAGEIVFILVALLPWWMQFPLGFVWTVFHLLVIVIQAFIFMMLTIVYLGLAQESH